MSTYKVVLSPIKDIASKDRLRKYYLNQKELNHPVYYLLPSNKWLQAARKKQPGMAFKTFDDIADLILKTAEIKYVPTSEAERDLFFQQLLSTEGNNTSHNAHKAKAYSQTYGQLKRLGLTLKDLPSGLYNLRPALENYEDEWVKKRRLLDPENRFHEAIQLEGLVLPLGEVIIDGYMDFSPLQYRMLSCLINNNIPVTIYIQGIVNTQIVEDTLKNLQELDFEIKGAKDHGLQKLQISVSKAITQEEEIRGVLNAVQKKIKGGTPPEAIGIVLGDEEYKLDLLRLAEQNDLQISIPKKLLVSESIIYKTISLLFKQSSFTSKWDRLALIDQLYQILFISREVYWKSKKVFLNTGELPQGINDKLENCLKYRRSFKKEAPLVEVIDDLITFLQGLNLVDNWTDKIKVEETTDRILKIRNEWVAYDTVITLLNNKKRVLEEQGLQEMTINLNVFSGWFHELVREKEIYLDRKPAKGIGLYSFRDVAMFKGEVLYLMAMNEGVFPSVHKVGGYFQESDLKSMQNIYGLPTKTTFRKKDEGTFKQLFYLASEINASYVCGFDPENEYQPSPFIEKYCADVAYLCAENRYKQEPLNYSQGFEQIAFMLGMGKRVENAPKDMIEIQECLKRLNGGLEKVAQKLTRDLVGSKVGATTLEQYAACPFRFGMERLLKIREPKTKEERLNPLYTGSMLHTIIEKFYGELGVIGKKFSDMPENSRKHGEELLLKIFDKEWEYIKNKHRDMHPYDLEHQYRKWESMLKKWWIAEKELFWNNSNLKDMQLFKLEEPVEYTLEFGDENLTIIGKVDRIDVDKEGFAIYDYKSGEASMKIKQEVIPGLKLQIPLYILAVQNRINSGKYPELVGFSNLTAHGGSYISLKDPMKRATNGVWRRENVGAKGRFKVSSRTNKEENLEGEALMDKYQLKDKIKELWSHSQFDYSVRPLKCYPSCPYNGVCRVTEELKEEGESGSEFEA